MYLLIFICLIGDGDSNCVGCIVELLAVAAMKRKSQHPSIGAASWLDLEDAEE